ncbi:MAG: HAD family phosphatase [Clostridia bacterium]|nr:HAD family phosphatase [Clostridia bacterium]
MVDFEKSTNGTGLESVNQVPEREKDFDFGKYRLVACDMDGTMLADDHMIPELHRRAVRICQRNGVSFAIASGRAYRALGMYMKVLEEKGFVIAYNGARISTADMKTELLRLPLMTDDVFEVFRLSEDFGATLCVWADEKLYINRRNRLARDYAKLSGCGWEYFSTEKPFFLKETKSGLSNCDKLFWTDTPERAVRLAENVRGAVPETVNFFTSGAGYMEFIDSHVNKGAGLKAVCEYTGIDAGCAVAFGDAENDIPMLREAGLAVAMGNAEEAVKAEADYITDTNNEAGVYTGIVKLFGRDRSICGE